MHSPSTMTQQSQVPSINIISVVLVCIHNDHFNDITTDNIYQHFKNTGQVQKILIFDRSGSLWKAFVEFLNPSQADEAKKLTGSLMDNNPIQVYESKLPNLNLLTRSQYSKDYTKPTQQMIRSVQLTKDDNKPLKDMYYSQPADQKNTNTKVQENNTSNSIDTQTRKINELHLQFINDQMELLKIQQKKLLEIMSSSDSNQQTNFTQNPGNISQSQSQSLKGTVQEVKRNFINQQTQEKVGEFNIFQEICEVEQEEVVEDLPNEEQSREQTELVRIIQNDYFNYYSSQSFGNIVNLNLEILNLFDGNPTATEQITTVEEIKQQQPQQKVERKVQQLDIIQLQFENSNLVDSHNPNKSSQCKQQNVSSSDVQQQFQYVPKSKANQLQQQQPVRSQQEQIKVVYVRWFYKEQTTLRMIYNIFSTFGNIEKMIYFKLKQNVLIQYSSEASAKFLMNNFTGLVFFGQKMKAYSSNYKSIFFKNCSEGEKPQDTADEEYFVGDPTTYRFSDNIFKYLVPPSSTIHITNLKKQYCNEESLLDLFSKFGNVIAIKIISEENNKNKALIKYDSIQSSLHALGEMHNYDIHGRKIQIFFSQIKL